MTATRTTSPARWRRPLAWLRLPAAAAVPLALAGATLIPSAATAGAAGHPARAVTATTVSAASAKTEPGLQQLQLPGLHAASATVTLITGDQVRLTSAGGGRYSAAAIPGHGGASNIEFQAQGNPSGLTSLQAVPDDAQALISTGQADQGLFDLRYLAAHGDTGQAARIPVTIQYASRPGADALRHDAAGLPGASVLATTPASGEVRVSVAAGRTAAFWAALTRHAATPASLAGGAIRVWLTGHRVPATASAQPQDGQPLYTVSETMTRATGPIDYGCGDGSGTGLAANACFEFRPQLFGVAGSGEGNVYRPGGRVCVSETQAKPFPVCTAWQVTFSVPAGVYFADTMAHFLTTADPEGALEETDATLDVPQFTVTADTAISLNADNAVPVTVSTPQPGVPYGPDEVESSRLLPDGTYYTSVVEDLFTQGVSNWWALPTPAGNQATIGGYHFSPGQTLGANQVTAAVTEPSHLTLHPIYPCDSDDNFDPSCNVARFSGRKTLQLVNAGYGTPSDFRTIDARGKLALISTVPVCPTAGLPDCAAPGQVLPEQLTAAENAGAAGVIIDAGTDENGYPSRLPALVNLTSNLTPPANFPFAEIDNAEGNTLLGLLAKGPVTVTVSDSGETPFAYFLRFDQEAQIPASLHYTLTGRQLAEITSSYHAASPPPEGIQAWGHSFRPDDNLAVSNALDFPGPRGMHEYYGPLSPSLVWGLDESIPGPSVLADVNTVFSQPSSSTLGWNEPPLALGAETLDADVYQAQPGFFLQVCAGCRQGNTFWPVFYPENGANPGTTGATGFAPGSIQLYNQAGQAVSPTTDPATGFTTYQLPPQQARYKLVTPSTTWDFTSAEPASDQTPPGTGCGGTFLGESTAPCQADPLVFLRYDAGLSLANTVSPGPHQLQVTAYRQDPAAPPVISLKLWISTDGGTTWQQSQVSGGRDGTYTVRYTVPPAASTNGYVSIKAQAFDAAGNDVTQQIDDAFGIASATALHPPGG